MFQRLLGIITLKAPVYREVAEDTTATPTAAMIVVVVALISGFSSKLINPDDGSIYVVGALISAVIAVIMQLISWGVGGWLLSTVAGAFGGKTNTGEMLRVTGFTSAFGVIAVLNLLMIFSPAMACLVGPLALVAAVLAIVGNVIGVREAAEFSTGNAVITSVIVGVVNFIILSIGAFISTGVILMLVSI